MRNLKINIFLPRARLDKSEGALGGYAVELPDELFGIYIIDGNDSSLESLQTFDGCSNHDRFRKRNVVIGKFSDARDSSIDSHLDRYENCFKLTRTDSSIEIVSMKIDGAHLDVDRDIENSTIIFYDYFEFLKSENLTSRKTNVCNYDEGNVCRLNQFHVLKNLISHDTFKCQNNSVTADADKNYKCFDTIMRFIAYLSTFSNLFFNILHLLKLIYWSISPLRDRHKSSLKIGNLVLVLLLDFVCGLILLYYNDELYPPLINKLFEVIDVIIPNLQSLLKWLMGSPAGLKLNHAFNNMLGKFFLYHVNLWWIFLEIFRDVLEVAIKLIQCLGILGITFQAAILADLLSLASVHFYCIYIYAARLYNTQLKGLIALWRLFLGRKHNPLRTIVDSCHYDHHQLFIGTLGFTVLLFLLPTTIMYYVVFTTFRLMQLCIGSLLNWIQFIIRSLPLYSLWLWLIRSPKVAGDIQISVCENLNTKIKPLLLMVKLRAPSLTTLVQIYKPDPIPAPSKINWYDFISRLWRGERF